MIKQMKGKMFNKLPKTKVPYDDRAFYGSTKFDGHYTQIHVDCVQGTVEFFTSGGKPYRLKNIAPQLLKAVKPLGLPIVYLEAEYLYRSLGKLGDRVYSARDTTYRTEFAKGNILSHGSHLDTFKIFNIIDESKTFETRLRMLEQIVEQESVHVVKHIRVTYSEAMQWAKTHASNGWEGIMIVCPDIFYEPGKRTNDIIKIKFRPELIATVIEEEEGEGRLEGAIGALKCTLPGGITFSVGSGLDDYMRSLWGAFLNKQIEVEYEQMSADGIPLQPVFKRVKGGQ